MEEEIWQPIQGYEGTYEVSTLGRVRSLNRVVERSDGIKRTYKSRILKPCISYNGYAQVKLQINSTSKGQTIHRLVAIAFIPNIENKPQVNHKDGNKLNNQASNLEWITPSENIKHQITTGLQPKQSIGKESSNYKGDIHVFDSTGTLVDILVGKKDMVSKGYNPGYIYNILAGRRKTHKGCTFKRVPLTTDKENIQ